MVVRIVRNNTASPIILSGLDGVTVPASGELDLGLSFDADRLATSDSLATHIASGDLSLIINGQVIEYPRSADIIRNVAQYFTVNKESKLMVQPTERPVDTYNVFTGCDDNGNLIYVQHNVFQYGIDVQNELTPVGVFVDDGLGTPTSTYWLNTKYIEFNTADNRTYMSKVIINWQIDPNACCGAQGVSVDIVSKSFSPAAYMVTPGTGNAVIVGGYLVIPYAGGMVDLPFGQTEDQTPQNLNFQQCMPNMVRGEYYAPAFWSIDYNLLTKQYFNLLPNPTPYSLRQNTDSGVANTIRMVGNLFVTEVPLYTFIRNVTLLGQNGRHEIIHNDPHDVGANLRIRVRIKTYVNQDMPNRRWGCCAMVHSFREKAL